MTTLTAPTAPGTAAPQLRSSTASAFGALLLRDLTVLRKNLKEFVPRTIIQPFLLVFVFTYVFPKIGQGVGGSGAAAGAFSSVLVAGVVAGALQCLLAGLIVFPIAAVVPATPVHLEAHWLVLLTLIPIACLMSGAMGLVFGTLFDPRTVPMLFGVILIPITFLGCTYYSWQALEPVRWLQIATMLNPLVYVSEGFRGALTDVPHMSLLAVYPVMIGFTALFTWQGIRGFTRRVIA